VNSGATEVNLNPSILGVRVMVLNTTFNNISVILWQSVLGVELIQSILNINNDCLFYFLQTTLLACYTCEALHLCRNKNDKYCYV